nr:MAG TPA: hypothetical protein [Caudoviricetes sp.]
MILFHENDSAVPRQRFSQFDTTCKQIKTAAYCCVQNCHQFY